MRKRGTNQRFVYAIPSKKAVMTVTTRIGAKTNRSTLHMDLDELLLGLYRAPRG
jgi:RNA-directed DNA polymerase